MGDEDPLAVEGGAERAGQSIPGERRDGLARRRSDDRDGLEDRVRNPEVLAVEGREARMRANGDRLKDRAVRIEL